MHRIDEAARDRHLTIQPRQFVRPVTHSVTPSFQIAISR
jgi:hypothetical protein